MEETDKYWGMSRLRGRGEFDISGDASFVGKYVQVSSEDGQVGCCMIEELEEGEKPDIFSGKGKKDGKEKKRDGKKDGKRMLEEEDSMSEESEETDDEEEVEEG